MTMVYAADHALGRLVERHFPDRPSGYFDTASIGLVPASVAREAAEALTAQRLGIVGSGAWRERVAMARQEIAADFGVHPEDLDVMASTAEALTALALACELEGDGEVLVLSDEYPTVIDAWTQNPRVGGHVVAVAPPADEDRTGALLAAVGPRTRVISVSHVHYGTGTRVDLAALGAAARQVGALLVVDGAQGAVLCPFDPDDADFYIATGYKWQLAGFGGAVVLSTPRGRGALRRSAVTWNEVPPAARLTSGHLNLTSFYALGAAARVRREIGADVIRARVRVLVARLHTELTALGLPPAARQADSAGIISLPGIPDPDAAVRTLREAGFIVANRTGRLRVSPNFYSSDAEVDGLLRALKPYATRS
ncbi:aminotransferase class V-fold PLP-dependent enzyme [Streptomyces sp. NPDC059373]